MHNRVLFFVGLAMAFVTITVTTFLIVDRFNQISAIRTGFWDNIAYTTSQSDFELLRLIDTLQRVHDQDADVVPEDIDVRFELALSRFVGLTEGRTGQRILANDFAREMVTMNISTLEGIETRILQFDELESVEQHQLIEKIRALSEEFHRATVMIASSGDRNQIDFFNKLMQTARVEIVLLFLVFCGGALFFANGLLERKRFIALNQSLTEKVAERTSELQATNQRLIIENKERTKSEDRYRSLVELANDAIMIIDITAGKIIEANPRAVQIFGYSMDELLGNKGPAEISPPYQADGRKSEVAARGNLDAVLHHDLPTIEWIHRHRDGHDFPCEVSLARFPDPDRKLARASVVDVSERINDEKLRQDLQTQLNQAQKLEAIGQMTGGVAHDFNNLLNVILGNLELLQELTDTTESEALIEAAIEATFKGADLTKSMLSFARRAHLQPTQFNLSEIVQTFENWIGRTIPARITVKKSLQQDLWPIEADLTSTESAILNLIINARDAMPDGGVITLETENVFLDEGLSGDGEDKLSPGRYALLAVSDTGTGIEAKHLDRVFDPFFTTKGPAGGSGLGLSMVHGFMRQTGGGARIYSSVGTGTTVKLYFPVLGEPDLLEPLATVTEQQAPSKKGRILVAEDQVSVADLLVRFLRDEGHDVVPAYTGDRAFEIFESDGAFDLLVTDIVMPGQLQGPELARKIRNINPQMPVVFMSGYAREATIHGNGLRDEDTRLMKPVSKKTLISAVHSALVPRE